QIVAHCAPVGLDDAVTRRKFQLGGETRRRNVCDQHAAPPNLCHRRFYCKLVHRKISLKAKPVGRKSVLIINRTVSLMTAPDSTRADMSTQRKETKVTRNNTKKVDSCSCCFV